jgi:hypothetical protein
MLVVFLTFAHMPVFGQAQTLSLEELKTQIERRYTVLPIQNGIVLSPRNKNEIVSVEISGNRVAVNGAEVTGGELRMRLGTETDLILQLSYLTPSALQTLFSVDGNQNPLQVTPPPVQRVTPPRRGSRKNDIVRFGGDVTVERGESVDGDVVVFGGNGQIDGEVNGDAVVIGGRLTLGPEANVVGDVAVVGGTLSRDPGASVGGEVSEVSVGPGARFGEIVRNGGLAWSGMRPWLGVAGTAARVALLILFACIVMIVAGGLANRIGDRAAAEPVRAGLTGLLAELLFVPALIMTVVLLVITIVGIPLLVLVPLALLALVVVFLLGFTSVAARVGQLISTRLGWTNIGPYLTTILGIVTLVLPILLARLLGLLGVNFIALPLLVAGAMVEYLAWTVGFGAAALTYLKPPAARSPQSAAGTEPSAPQGVNA